MYSYEQDEGGIPKSSGTVKRAVLQAAGPFVKKKRLSSLICELHGARQLSTTSLFKHYKLFFMKGMQSPSPVFAFL